MYWTGGPTQAEAQAADARAERQVEWQERCEREGWVGDDPPPYVATPQEQAEIMAASLQGVRAMGFDELAAEAEQKLLKHCRAHGLPVPASPGQLAG